MKTWKVHQFQRFPPLPALTLGTKTQKAKGIPDNAEIFTQETQWKNR